MAQYQLDLVRADRERWLKQYYFVRAAFSVAWVAAAFAVGAVFSSDRRRLARPLSRMGRRGQLRGRVSQRRARSKPHAGSERCGQPGDHRRGARDLADEHEPGARNLRGVGDPVRIAPAGDGHPPLAEVLARNGPWCSAVASRRSQAASSSFRPRCPRFPRSRMSRAMLRSVRSTSWSRRSGSRSASGGVARRCEALRFEALPCRSLRPDRACRPCARTGRRSWRSSCRCRSKSMRSSGEREPTSR